MGVFTNATISKAVRAFCVRFSLKHCNYILPVDETLIEYTNNYIVPFHYSDSLETFNKEREPDDMDTLIYLNREKIDILFCKKIDKNRDDNDI